MTHNILPAPGHPRALQTAGDGLSLVLASQDIAATIQHTESGWVLSVDKPEFERARAALGQYQIENRGWQWRREWPGAGLVFHWGDTLWVLGIAAIYYWSMVRFPLMKDAGMVDSFGQCWAAMVADVTAVTLHENLPASATPPPGFCCWAWPWRGALTGVAALAAFLAGVGDWRGRYA